MENCFKPLHTIVACFNAYTGLNLSERSGRRYMKLLKMSSCIAVQKPFLSKKNIDARILWARTHKNWSLNQWGKVAFTDESCFTVRPTRNRLRVWRLRGTRLIQENFVPTFKSGYQSVSVWGGFSIHGRTPLVGTTGSFDRHTYRTIIDNHILPFIYDVHGGTDGFILQEDNCGPHRARSIATYLESEDVTRMHWPAQSPDLNPIENVWGFMKAQLQKLSVPPSNPMQLFGILSEMWNSLPDSFLENLVASMPNRVDIVLKQPGKSTKY